MPFKSKAQMRLFFAKEKRGELPKGTAKRWAEHTPSIKKLPEKKKKKAANMTLADFIRKVYEAKFNKEASEKVVKLKLPKINKKVEKPISLVKDRVKSDNAKSGQKVTILKGMKLTTGKKK